MSVGSFLTGFGQGGMMARDIESRNPLTTALAGSSATDGATAQGGQQGGFLDRLRSGNGPLGQNGVLGRMTNAGGSPTPPVGGGRSIARMPPSPSMSRSGENETYDGIGLPPSLIRTESGGNFNAENGIAGSGGNGHFGRGQFSQGRLADAARAGVIPEGTTPQQFLASQDMQQRVEAWHVSDINDFITRNGLDRFVGQEINGQVVTPNGMIAVAHLGGNAGLRRYLESGGSRNPADAFGTSLSAYMTTHAGTPTLAAQPAPTTRPAARPAAAPANRSGARTPYWINRWSGEGRAN